MSDTSESRLSLQLRTVMAAVDDPARAEELRTLFSPEARFRLGNVAPVVGRDAIYADLGVSLHEHMPRMRHELVTTGRRTRPSSPKAGSTTGRTVRTAVTSCCRCSCGHSSATASSVTCWR
jgi:hypothetical protein